MALMLCFTCRLLSCSKCFSLYRLGSFLRLLAVSRIVTSYVVVWIVEGEDIRVIGKGEKESISITMMSLNKK